MQTYTIRTLLKQFAHDFLQHPYTCYTEHGYHALFYTMLYNALPAEQRYINWCGQKVCVIQKEYPTAADLGKSKRQNWDISVIKTPPESILPFISNSYDYLKLSAVVEFGLNEAGEHLLDDIVRLSHIQANVEQGFLVHLYRLSKPGTLFSHRDWSPKSPRIISKVKVASWTRSKTVEVIYGLCDTTGTCPCGVWLIRNGIVEDL